MIVVVVLAVLLGLALLVSEHAAQILVTLAYTGVLFAICFALFALTAAMIR